MSINIQHPFITLKSWLSDAANIEKHYNAATLSTITADNEPNSRIVYIHLNHENKILFYTNLESIKANEIAGNNNISLCIFWPNIEKQIRITGTASLLNEEAATAYFNNRTTAKKIAAWSSKQSSLLTSRTELLEKFNLLQQKFKNKTIEKPPFWGGFSISISQIEFWYMHQDRLHERHCFKIKNNNFEHFNLYP